MLIIIIGQRGSGKTLLCTYLGLYALKRQKRTIITNYHIKFDSNQIDFSKLAKSEYERSTILIDEVYAYIDSRKHSTDSNLFFSYFLFQSRKTNVDVIITAQLIKSIDKRFRLLADFIIEANNEIDFFHYTIYNTHTNQISELYMPISYAQKIFQMYDTNEIIKTDLQSNAIKLAMSFKNGDEKLQIIHEIALDCIAYYANFEKITLGMISNYLMKKEIAQIVKNNVFTEIQIIKKEEQKKE